MKKHTIALIAGLAVLCLAVVAVLLWRGNAPTPDADVPTTGLVIPISSTAPGAEAVAGTLPYITHEEVLAVSVAPPPGEHCAYLVTEDGILTVGRDSDGEHYALLRDGQFWVSLDIETDDFYVMSLVQSGERLYILSTDHDNAIYLDILDANGQPEVSGQFIDSSRIFPQTIEQAYYVAIYEQTLYILSSSWSERTESYLRSYSLETMALNEDPFPEISSGYLFQRGFTLDSQGNLYFAENQKTTSYIYKLSPNGSFESYIIGTMTLPLNIACYDDVLYVMTTEKVSAYTLEGQLVEHLLAFADDVPLLPSGLPIGLCLRIVVLSPDEMILPYMSGTTDSEQARFIKLTRLWVDTLPPEPEKTQLVFTMAYPNENLVQAIRLYEVINPDIDIVVDALAVDVEDAIRNATEISTQLATRLLTGQAGDLYSMGGEGLRYYDLLKTDAFIDLTDRLEPIRDTLYDHMLEGIRVNGAIRALPVGMDPRYFVYDVDWGQSLGYDFDPYEMTASTMIEIAAAMQAQGDIRSPLGYSFEYLFNEVILANLYDLIDPEAETFDLRQPWFLKLMEDFKEIYIPASEDRKQIEYLFDLQMQISNYWGMELWFGDPPQNQKNLRYLPNIKSEVSGFRATRSQYLYAIPSTSEQQEEAWSFLEFLASKYGQDTFANTAHLSIEYEEQMLTHVTPETAEDIVAITSSVTHLHSIFHAEFDIIMPLREYLLGNATLDYALTQAEYNLTLRFNE